MDGVKGGFADQGLHGRRLLLIDSDEKNRVRFSDLLSGHGAVIDHAPTADAGVATARNIPDLILIAIRLSDGHGVEVAERLRSDPATRDIPIVHHSAIPAGDDMLVDSLAAGANTLLFEPITDEMLLATIRSILQFRDTQRDLETAFSFEASGAFDWRIAVDEFVWAPSLQFMHGIEPDQFGGTLQSFLDLVHPDDRPTVEQAFTFWSMSEDNDEIDVKFRTTQRLGVGWLECRGTALRDQEGTRVRLLGVMFDVTERETDRRRVDQMRRVAERLSMARTSTMVMNIGRRELRQLGFRCRVAESDETAETPESHIVRVGDQVLELFEIGREGDADENLEQARAVTHVMGSALKRATQFDSERANAEAFQRALLPPKFPPIAGWDIDVEYEPAGSEDRLGGDFYDLILLDQRFVVVVGDVAGHGLQATQQMGVIRNMLRTLAVQSDGDPGRVIEEAAELANRVAGSEAPFVTAVVASIELDDGAVRISSAGHPPPLVWSGGSFTILPIEPRPPLGVEMTVPTAVQTTLLGPGDGLVAYTDGVFERRDISMFDAITTAIAGSPPRINARGVLQMGQHDALNIDDQAVVLAKRL